MARKKSYRKYRRKSQKGPDLPEAIAGSILLLGLAVHVYVRPYFETHKEQIIHWMIIVSMALGLLLAVLVGLFVYKRYQKSQLSSKDGRDVVFSALIQEIQSFSSIRNHKKEAHYQMELAGYLKKTFPNLDIEETRSDTRPDIVV